MNWRLLDGHCYISCDCPIILARYAIGTDTYMPDSAIKFLSVLAAALRNVLAMERLQRDRDEVGFFITIPIFIHRITHFLECRLHLLINVNRSSFS